MFLRHLTAVTRNRRGFTLLEIILALGITAIVLSVVYTTMRTAGRSLQSLSVRNELYRATYALLEEIGTELSSSFLSPHGHPLNGRAITYFRVEDEEEGGMPRDNLYFTTLGHAYSPLAQGESDQSEICYTVRHSRKRDELVLLKKEDITLDDRTCLDDADFSLDRPYAELPIPVATGIHPEQGVGYRLMGFQVECYRTNGPDEEPVEEWDTETDRKLPSRVTVTLTFQDEKGQLYPFSKTVLLRLQELSL
jgi:prepilin-type N-terminal cleavage/methylation domain-containing protein